jgi:guanylate kinase
MKNKLIVFTGPSAVGKYTIEKELFKDKNLDIQLSISATTRKPRSNEKDGVHYNFISEKEFVKKIQDNKFIE